MINTSLQWQEVFFNERKENWLEKILFINELYGAKVLLL